MPIILREPLNQSVARGSSASFSVKALDSQPMQYQWFKEGAAIPGATRSIYRIAHVQPTDIGVYAVQVISRSGTTMSSRVGLTIPGLPTAIWRGLVAYYPFNGDASDQSGNGNDGNAVNVVYDVDRFGHPNSSADFSSGDAYVEIPSLNAMAYQPVTYSAWFKLNSYPTAEERRDDGFFAMTLVGREYSGSAYEGALCLYSPYLRGADNSIAYYTGTADVPGQMEAPTNEWTQVVFTLDAANNATFYWNGKLLDRRQYTEQQSDVIPFRIGASGEFYDYRLGWRGSIDDVRIYNRALSAKEVAQLYASEAPPVPRIVKEPQSQTVDEGSSVSFSVVAESTVPLNYQWSVDGMELLGATEATYGIASVQPTNTGDYTVVIRSILGSVTSTAATLSISGMPNTVWRGLVAYYPFNGDASDQSGNGNDGNAVNVVYDVDRFGHPNSSADFSSGDAYVEIPSLNAMAYQPVTYSAWFKLNSYPTAEERRDDGFFAMTLLGRELSGSPYEGALCLYNPGQRGADNSIAYYTGTADVPGQKTAPINVWTQVVFTLDAANSATFYWNGKLLDQRQYTEQQSDVIPFRIGASGEFYDYRLGWRGSIDDVRIYNRALSAHEVARLYASEARPAH